MTAFRNWLSRVEHLFYDAVYKYDTKLYELFIGLVLLLYGAFLFIPGMSTILHKISALSCCSYIFGFVALLSSYLILYGLLGNGDVKRQKCRKLGAMLGFLFFSCGAVAAMIKPSTALAVFLPAVITTAAVYLRITPNMEE